MNALKKYSNASLIIKVPSEHLKPTDSGNLVPVTEDFHLDAFLKSKSASMIELPGGDANTFLIEGYLTSPLPESVKNLSLSGKYQGELNGDKGILSLLPTLNSPFPQVPTRIQGTFTRQN